MTGSELATIQQATSTVAAVVNAAGSLVNVIRANGLVRAEARQLLKDRVVALRHQEIARNIASVALVNIEELADLFDAADRHRNSPELYANALRAATQAAQLLERNLDELAKAYRS